MKREKTACMLGQQEKQEQQRFVSKFLSRIYSSEQEIEDARGSKGGKCIDKMAHFQGGDEGLLDMLLAASGIAKNVVVYGNLSARNEQDYAALVASGLSSNRLQRGNIDTGEGSQQSTKFRRAFPCKAAEDVCACILRKMSKDVGVIASDRTTWPEKERLGIAESFSVLDGLPWSACFTPRLVAAFNQLAGEGRWDPESLGLGWWVLSFPREGESRLDGGHGTWAPTGSMHVDGAHFSHHIDSPEVGLLPIFLFTEIGPSDGGTAIVPGSHHVVAEILAEERLFDEDSGGLRGSQHDKLCQSQSQKQKQKQKQTQKQTELQTQKQGAGVSNHAGEAKIRGATTSTSVTAAARKAERGVTSTSKMGAKKLTIQPAAGKGTHSKSTPLSTPRRRLRDALQMEKIYTQKLEAQGWKLVVRAGKKIEDKYTLVTGWGKFPDVRVTVYQTQSCRLQEFNFQHEEDLNDLEPGARKKIVYKFLDDFGFDKHGDLVLQK
eukprot:g2922.t1